MLDKCYSIKVFKRVDNGFTICYRCLKVHKERNISERFEVGEKVIIRHINHKVIKNAYDFYKRYENHTTRSTKEHIAILKEHLGALDLIGVCVAEEAKKYN